MKEHFVLIFSLNQQQMNYQKQEMISHNSSLCTIIYLLQTSE